MYRSSCFLFVKSCARYYSTKLDKSQTILRISEEVRAALVESKPVVALESTIITHGMPYPNNVKCALEVEDIVRSQGAVPATIALLNGNIHVGLTRTSIEYLGDTRLSKPIKTSRRDIPYMLATKQNGGTTVSGTIIVCNMVGISIFATGGIGGVHRGAENSFDISADLTELGRSNVAVVSSGIKSILDIPKTLEYLETQGVFVATMGLTTDFPAFYSRSSGSHAPYCVNNPKDAANIVKSHHDMGLQSGLLFGVPVPEEYALDRDMIDDLIKKALEKADRAGIKGKDVTPFLLSEIAKTTSGNSLDTNIALIKNNVKVAAQIAAELVKLQKGLNNGGVIETTLNAREERPVIIGGSNLDCVAHLEADEIKLDGRTHVGRLDYAAGGVGRNICEALGKLGRSCHFISAVGDDPQGRILLKSIPEESSNYVKTYPGYSSAQCIVVLEKDGSCPFLMGDMSIHTRITPEVIESNQEIIKQSPLVILDGNVATETMAKVLEIASLHAVPVFYEPTDISIAIKPFTTQHWRSIKFLTPNLNELKHIYSHLHDTNTHQFGDKCNETVDILKNVANVIDNVIVTLGDEGILIARKASARDPFFKGNKATEVSIRHYPVKKRNDIVNVSGAGDCFASGFIAAVLENLPEEACVSVGFASALTALYSQSPVPHKIFNRNHESWKQYANYVTIL